MKKEKAKQGFLKELKSPPKEGSSRSSFNYAKPVNKIERVKNMAVNARTREYRSVAPDTTTNFALEQKNAKASHSHKGNK